MTFKLEMRTEIQQMVNPYIKWQADQKATLASQARKQLQLERHLERLEAIVYDKEDEIQEDDVFKKIFRRFEQLNKKIEAQGEVYKNLHEKALEVIEMNQKKIGTSQIKLDTIEMESIKTNDKMHSIREKILREHELIIEKNQESINLVLKEVE